MQLLQRDQEVIGFQAVVRDISIRKQTEEALRVSQERYRALFESSPEMLLTVDARGTLLTVNTTTAAELGYEADELIGQPVARIVHPDDHGSMDKHFADSLRRPGEVLRWNFRKMRKDGSLLWCEKPPEPCVTPTDSSISSSCAKT